MFSTTATMPAWEQSIRAHAALSVLGLKTGSTHSLRAFEAAQFTASVYSEDAPLPDDVKNHIVGIHGASIQDIQTGTEAYTDAIKGLENTQPNEDTWKAKILSANQAAIQNFVNRINAAGDQAIQAIQGLPVAQQNAAAFVYKGGMSIVNTVVNQATDAIQTVIGFLKDMLQGIWNEVTNLYNDVKTWCSGALSTLSSLFGSGFLSAFTRATRGDAVAAAAVQSFTGFVGWGATIGMGLARATFDEILDRLDHDAYISVASQKLSIVNVQGQGPSIVGRVRFGAKFAMVRESTAELSEVWEKALHQPQKPLSTTPLPISQQDWQKMVGGSDEDARGRRPGTPGLDSRGSTFPRGGPFAKVAQASNGLLDVPATVA